jgi:hypothetical protein
MRTSKMYIIHIYEKEKGNPLNCKKKKRGGG